MTRRDFNWNNGRHYNNVNGVIYEVRLFSNKLADKDNGHFTIDGKLIVTGLELGATDYEDGEQLLFSYIEDKYMKSYTEEDVMEILKARSKKFSTGLKPFNALLLKQDLDWFEETYKKK